MLKYLEILAIVDGQFNDVCIIQNEYIDFDGLDKLVINRISLTLLDMLELNRRN